MYYPENLYQEISGVHTKVHWVKNPTAGVPVVAQWLTNPTRNHEVAGSVPAVAQWRIVNPLSKGRDRTRNLMVPSRIR